MHNRVFSPYHHNIVSIASDSLSQYLVQFMKQSFSPKLREEWDRHVKGRKDLPTLEELQTFVDDLAEQMSPDSIDPGASSMSAASSSSKNKLFKSPSVI